MPDDEERIISFMARTGPLLPNQLAKFLGCNILIASAHLSDLVARNKVLVSDLKIGGSPLYYLPGLEPQLVRFIGHLNQRDQETASQLQEQKILRERDLDLFTKVSLRNIKDFAKPLKVTIENVTELFWKWYQASDGEAQEKVHLLLAPPVPITAPAPEPAVKVPVLAPEPVISVSRPATTVPTPPTALPESVPFPREKKLAKRLSPRSALHDSLFPQIESFLKKKEITIEAKETVRKGIEMNLIVKVPTDIGPITYFCKVKDKKRCDDKDLSSAYMEGQMKKLPTLLIYTNELHKRAEELLQSGMFANLQAMRLK